MDGFLSCRQLQRPTSTCCSRQRSSFTFDSKWRRRPTTSLGHNPAGFAAAGPASSSNRWINANDFDSLNVCGASDAPPTHTGTDTGADTSLVIDAAAYNQRDFSPTYWRLARSTVTNGATAASNNSTAGAIDHHDDPFVQNADYAVEATLRWCSDFVAKLNLCPWAKLSLAERNAIRVKIVDQTLGIDSFEQIVRDSGLELLKLTGCEAYSSGDMAGGGEEDAQYIDPNVAITFIVALPPIMDGDYNNEEQKHLPDFDFAPFHDFVFDLEDRLFEEADAFADAGEEEERQLQDCAPGTTANFVQVPIGDWITVAPFHPAWSFAGDADSPVAWEKRTPFPTVSIVRSDAIEAAGEEATSRIAKHNEEVLNDMGSHALRDLFRKNILQKDL